MNGPNNKKYIKKGETVKNGLSNGSPMPKNNSA